VTGIGEALRQARRARGLDLEQAADATKIRAQYLDDLEAERFDRLPAPVYARGFLREYADLLGLDAELLVAWFDQANREPVRPEIVARPTVPTRGRRFPGPRITVGIALALGALALWAFGQGSSPPNPLGNLQRQGPQAAPAAPAKAHGTAIRRGARRSRAQPAVLAAVRGDCWLAVRIGSRDGRAVFEGFLRRGRTLRLGLARPLWLRLGAPWNVELRVAGRRVAGLAAGSRPLNVLVSRKGVRPAT
jgi:hypothetical protein